MMKKKKNRFLVFCLSLIPGTGEMYLGFMKNGMSLLCLFALSCAITGYLNFGVLSVIPLVTWAYGFFHANNLGSLTQEELEQIEDEYVFDFMNHEKDSFKQFLSGKYNQAFAVVLILLGVAMLWTVIDRAFWWIFGDDLYNQYFRIVSNIISDVVPRAIFALFIIWVGVKLIKGKKIELEQLEMKEENQEKEEKEEEENSQIGE